MLLRSCFLAIAALVPSAGFSSSHADSYQYVRYPKDAFGHDANADIKKKRYHPAAHAVTCDRWRDICYDRYGISYYATVRYLGDRAGARVYKKYGDKAFLFSPARGIVCDRRTDRCSTTRWNHHRYGAGPSYGHNGGVELWRNKGAAPPRWYQQQHQHQQPNWR